MRIGILGSGLMGGKLGTLFARAGHEVAFSYARSRKKYLTDPSNTNTLPGGPMWRKRRLTANLGCFGNAGRRILEGPGFVLGKPCVAEVGADGEVWRVPTWGVVSE